MPSRPSYTRGSSTPALLDQTIGENLRRTVERVGESDALVSCHQGYRASYQQFWELTTAVAKALLGCGIRAGDRVAIWAPNRFEWAAVQYGAARAGAVLVCVNPAYEAAELRYALSRSGASLLIYASGFRDRDNDAVVREVRGSCPELRTVVSLDADWAPFLDGGAGVGADELAAREAGLDPHDPIAIQFTSGTTGRPKGATLTHHNILNNAYLVCAGIGYTPADRVCVPVPFYHCFGMVLGTLGATTHGATVVLPAEVFDPVATLRAVAGERCTSLYGVPMMFIAELEHPRFAEFDLRSLRTGLIGGASCPAELVGRIRTDLHVEELSIVCGMTETSPISTQTTVRDPEPARVGTVGRPTPHVEVTVVDPVTGEVVPTGVTGEQCTRGYSVMRGYWSDPEATGAAIDADGWMHTGDLAVMDADGYLAIVGRLKDVIIRGGENIYPREVEECLHRHPGIADAHVIGVPDARYGEQVMAWVRPVDGAELSGCELVDHCRGTIAWAKIPAYWKITDWFPATASGKVQKYRMRELSIVELGLTEARPSEHAG